MSMELITLTGIGVTVISTGVALAALILNTQRNLRVEMRAQRAETKTEFKAVREDMRAQRAEVKTEFEAVREDMQAQREEAKTEFEAVREETKTEFKAVREDMRAQREAIISLLERMAHLEGLLDGLREAITGRRVAEETGKYNTR